MHQFSSEQFVIWVVDVKRWQYYADDFKNVVYGETVEDLSIGRRLFVGFDDIYRAFEKNGELIHETGLMPSSRYPLKDGLFFLNEAKCFDGLVINSLTKKSFFPNPFSTPQLKFDTIRNLKGIFNSPPVSLI